MSSLVQQWSQAWHADSGPAGLQWLSEVRTNAVHQLAENGLPHRRDEDWKYTPMRVLEALNPLPLGFGESVPGGAEVNFTLLLDEPGCTVDIRNGQWNGHTGRAQTGLTIMSLAQGLERHEARLKKLIETADTRGSSGAFAALNTAFLEHGLVIHVSPQCDAGSVLLRWASVPESGARLHNFRIFLLLEPGSSLHLTEQFESLPGTGQAMNVMTQIELEPAARLTHVRLQNDPDSNVLLTSTQVTQARDSHYNYAGFDLGGGLVRHELQSVLSGSGAQANFLGAFVLDHQRHVDNHIRVEHVAPGCSSEQFFRGVLGGRSRGVFNGKALIQPGADGSSVRQSNANLLLSDLAEINTKPELEIYADEVVANHGATVGQLDETAVFYLRSRGLGDAAARRILTGAFCRAVTDKLGHALLADRIAQLMDEAMPSETRT